MNWRSCEWPTTFSEVICSIFIFCSLWNKVFELLFLLHYFLHNDFPFLSIKVPFVKYVQVLLCEHYFQRVLMFIICEFFYKSHQGSLVIQSILFLYPNIHDTMLLMGWNNDLNFHIIFRVRNYFHVVTKTTWKSIEGSVPKFCLVTSQQLFLSCVFEPSTS